MHAILCPFVLICDEKEQEHCKLQNELNETEVYMVLRIQPDEKILKKPKDTIQAATKCTTN